MEASSRLLPALFLTALLIIPPLAGAQEETDVEEIPGVSMGSTYVVYWVDEVTGPKVEYGTSSNDTLVRVVNLPESYSATLTEPGGTVHYADVVLSEDNESALFEAMFPHVNMTSEGDYTMVAHNGDTTQTWSIPRPTESEGTCTHLRECLLHDIIDAEFPEAPCDLRTDDCIPTTSTTTTTQTTSQSYVYLEKCDRFKATFARSKYGLRAQYTSQPEEAGAILRATQYGWAYVSAQSGGSNWQVAYDNPAWKLGFGVWGRTRVNDGINLYILSTSVDSKGDGTPWKCGNQWVGPIYWLVYPELGIEREHESGKRLNFAVDWNSDQVVVTSSRANGVERDASRAILGYVADFVASLGGKYTFWVPRSADEYTNAKAYRAFAYGDQKDEIYMRKAHTGGRYGGQTSYTVEFKEYFTWSTREVYLGGGQWESNPRNIDYYAAYRAMTYITPCGSKDNGACKNPAHHGWFDINYPIRITLKD